MITEAFGVPLKILDKLKKIIQEPWENYGDDDGPTSERLRRDGFWNDHIAVQAAIAVYKAPDPVTGLTDAQRERLEMLAEEAAEIVQCCTKILRHGYGSYHPDDPEEVSNRKLLEKELLDFWTVYERMAHHHDVAKINFYGTPDVWLRKLKYTHHQPPFHHPTLSRDK